MKEKLLLLYPGEFYSMNWGRLIRLKPHMVYLYSYLKDFFDVTVLDLENEFSRPKTDAERSRFKKNALDLILASEFDTVAISCWSSLNYLASKYFAEKIKAKNPGTSIIVGGYHPTFVPEDFNYPNTPFDHVVPGEIHNIFSKSDMDPNISGKTQEIQPDYISYPYFANQKTLAVFLSTGCPFKCRYCMEYKNQWATLPVNVAIDRISNLHEQLSPNYITIFDACFGLNKQWRREFLSELIKLNLDCHFWLETRVDVIDEKDIELMSQLNIKIDFGIESFSPTMLRIMDKTKAPDSFLESFLNISEICTSFKVLHDAYLIFNHPGETQQTYGDFERFFESPVKKQLMGGYLRIKYQRFSYYPGNYIYNHRSDFESRYGFKVLNPEWWKHPGDHYMVSRDIIPSTDESGRPFSVPLPNLSKMVKEFNRLSKSEALWKRLHTFT